MRFVVCVQDAATNKIAILVKCLLTRETREREIMLFIAKACKHMYMSIWGGVTTCIAPYIHTLS